MFVLCEYRIHKIGLVFREMPLSLFFSLKETNKIYNSFAKKKILFFLLFRIKKKIIYLLKSIVLS